MKWADFHPGQVLTWGPASLSTEEIIAFAHDWDPQWFHADPEVAARGRFGGLIASGWQTCALAMRMAVECALGGSESFASPGVGFIRWPHPVRPGDSLMFRGSILELRRSRSRPGLGILRWSWELLHEDGRAALEMEVTSMFDLD